MKNEGQLAEISNLARPKLQCYPIDRATASVSEHVTRTPCSHIVRSPKWPFCARHEVRGRMCGMIRKAIIVVLTLGAVGTIGLWADAFRGGRVTLDGRGFPGWCADLTPTSDIGLHVTVRMGAACVSFRCPVEPTEVGVVREFVLTGNLFYLRYPHGAFKPCILNAEHHYVEPPGMRLVMHSVCLPFWLLLISFAAYPTRAFIRRPLRRYRRRRLGLCIRCGYNLEGNVSGACSECGAAME